MFSWTDFWTDLDPSLTSPPSQTCGSASLSLFFSLARNH